MKTSTKRALAGAALLVSVLGGGLATSTPAFAGGQPPKNCTQDVTDPNCHGDGSGGQGGGNKRVSLDDSDITYLSVDVIEAYYYPSQWRSWSSFLTAMQNYWNAMAPAGSSCTFYADPSCSYDQMSAQRGDVKLRIYKR